MKKSVVGAVNAATSRWTAKDSVVVISTILLMALLCAGFIHDATTLPVVTAFIVTIGVMIAVFFLIVRSTLR